MSDFAICVRCGDKKRSYASTCSACGMRPSGEGLLVAWLLSTEHLEASQLEAAAARVKAGKAIRPTQKMIARAKRALGQHLSSDPGLTVRRRLLLLGTSLLITPWVGWALFFWWRTTRPRAALQSLALSLPASALFLLFVAWRAVGEAVRS